MKKISKSALIFAVIFASLSVLSHFFAYADAPVTLSRFTFCEAEYFGEVYDAGEISDGLCFVCAKGHNSGYIGSDGKTAIDFVYSYTGSFVDGLAPACVQYGKMGYIDKEGKFAIEPIFDTASEFSCGLALVTKGGKTGFIDKTGKFVDIIKSSEYTPISSFEDGVCWVENNFGERAVMSSSGKLLTGFDFVWSGEWSDGVCWASKNLGTDFNHINMGLIDTTGKFIIEPGKYTDAQPFSEGVCWVKKMDSDGIYLIDKEGFEYKKIADGRMPSTFSGGICVNLGDDVLSVMDTKGVVIWSSVRYFPIHYGGFSEGKMIVKGQKDNKYYIMTDEHYVKPEKEEATFEYAYENVSQGKNSDFEIALKIDSSYAIANGQRLMIDSANENVCAFVENGRTLLPMRFIAENLPGYSVTWDYLSESALVQSDFISILLAPQVSSAQIIKFIPAKRTYDNLTKQLDQPPINRHDRLFLPVRALCEMIGANVFYDQRGLVVVSSTLKNLDYDTATAYLEQLN